MNARLVCNKADFIHGLIMDEDANLACLRETYVGPERVYFPRIIPIWILHSAKAKTLGKGWILCYLRFQPFLIPSTMVFYINSGSWDLMSLFHGSYYPSFGAGFSQCCLVGRGYSLVMQFYKGFY